jgi:hypothetical protein
MKKLIYILFFVGFLSVISWIIFHPKPIILDNHQEAYIWTWLNDNVFLTITKNAYIDYNTDYKKWYSNILSFKGPIIGISDKHIDIWYFLFTKKIKINKKPFTKWDNVLLEVDGVILTKQK